MNICHKNLTVRVSTIALISLTGMWSNKEYIVYISGGACETQKKLLSYLRGMQ